MSSLLRAAYDAEATTYDARFGPLQREKHEALLAHPDVAEAMRARRVLDLGCGTGLLFERARAAGLLDEAGARRFLGCDLSGGMLAVARGRGLTVVQADLARLPFADGAFDLVCAATSLALVPGREGAGLDEIARVLGSAGLLAATVLRSAAPAFARGLSREGFVAGPPIACGQDELFVAART